MSTLGNVNPDFFEVPHPPAPVIDILTGATLARAATITALPALEPAAVPSTTPLVEFEEAAWAVLRDSQRWSENAYHFFKRTVDIVGSALLMILLSPVFLLIAIAIKLSSPGPVIFRQPRMAKDGRPFSCLKFRTMVPDAEQRLATDPALRAAFETNYKIKDDPRVSRVGALLRKTSMDELPQLWNVLRGEMTLVGPRPIVPPELEKYGLYAQKLLSVKPGVSGLWQTCGRSDTTYEQRVRFDMLYIDHRSALLDCKLLLLTVAAVCRKAGAC